MYRVFIHEGTCRINGCSIGSRVAVGNCCLVLQLICCSAVHTKMPNIFITRCRLKRQTPGQRGASQSLEKQNEPCLQRKTAASVIFTVFILWKRLVREKHPASARPGSVLSLFGVRQKVLRLWAAWWEVHTLPSTTLKYLYTNSCSGVKASQLRTPP